MDTVSQAALGVFTTDALCRRALGPKNIAIGMAAGILPDLDVIVPQLVELVGGNFYLSYLATHRTWSHSLVTAPALAMLFAAGCKKFPPFRQLKLLPLFLATWLAFITHILLDLCTSYGIELFWPLSRHRFALFWVPEIDLFFLPLLIMLLLLILVQNFRRRRSTKLSWIGLGAFCGYIAFGALMHQVVWQRFERSEMMANGFSNNVHRQVFPHLGSLLVWRAVEISDDKLKIARFDFGGNQSSAVHEIANHVDEIPEWLQASPEYATMRHATSSFLWVQRDSTAQNEEQFEMQDVRFALSPDDPNGLIAIAARRGPLGTMHCEVKSWYLGKTFLKERSYAQATAQLWQNILGE